MALRLCCGGNEAFLCGQNRLAGPRLHPIRPSRLAPKSWWVVGEMVPATMTRATGCCSYVCVDHASDEKGGGRVIENVVTLCPRRRPCGEGLLSEGDGTSEKRGGDRAPTGSWEKMDKWMHECIVEIVRNIEEAHFLVCVFSNNDARSGGGAALKLETEAANPKNWRAFSRRWVATPPDGVILVEEMQRDDGGGITGAQETLTTSTSTNTSTWGEGSEQDGSDDDDDGEDRPTSSSSYLQGGGGSSSSLSNTKT